MSGMLLLGCFFIVLIILIIQLSIISELQEIKADLYYYSEQKAGENDEFN